jgi:hypothetical protein
MMWINVPSGLDTGNPFKSKKVPSGNQTWLAGKSMKIPAVNLGTKYPTKW